MSEEELQQKIEFIIQQQAQFVVDLQKLAEAQTNSESRIGRLEGAVVTVVNLFGEMSKAQKAGGERTSALENKISILADKVDATNERVDALTEKLDVFINLILERTLGNGDGTGKNENN